MNREEILNNLWQEQERAYDLMTEYDMLPHCYGDNVLYQAEAYVVNIIGNNPQITITQIAHSLKKTTSACSQIVKKLVSKGLVNQTRNKDNKRIYNLTLTSKGQQLYKDHMEFNKKCQQNTFDMLSEFTQEELLIHTKIQSVINDSYQGDVDRSKVKYGIE